MSTLWRNVSNEWPIKTVAQRTGLSPHVIRIWEKRYLAVTPNRTGTNRRLYSEGDIERLTLLHQATRSGHPISQAVRLSTEALRELVLSNGQPAATPRRAPRSEANISATETIQQALMATRELDAESLERLLAQATLTLGHVGVLQQVVVPFTHEVGELWRVGALKVAHEHLATAVLRNYLSGFANAYSAGDSAPLLLVTTPVGQWHEVGALIIAAAAVTHGWRVTYLGPNLPAEEIAGAAWQNRARAVALSIVYPEDDPRIPPELLRLRQGLPPETAVLAGGRAAPAYAEALREINALMSTDLPTFYQRLEELRVRRSHTAVSA